MHHTFGSPARPPQPPEPPEPPTPPSPFGAPQPPSPFGAPQPPSPFGAPQPPQPPFGAPAAGFPLTPEATPSSGSGSGSSTRTKVLVAVGALVVIGAAIFGATQLLGDDDGGGGGGGGDTAKRAVVPQVRAYYGKQGGATACRSSGMTPVSKATDDLDTDKDLSPEVRDRAREIFEDLDGTDRIGTLVCIGDPGAASGPEAFLTHTATFVYLVRDAGDEVLFALVAPTNVDIDGLEGLGVEVLKEPKIAEAFGG